MSHIIISNMNFQFDVKLSSRLGLYTILLIYCKDLALIKEHRIYTITSYKSLFKLKKLNYKSNNFKISYIFTMLQIQYPVCFLN